VLRLTCFSGKNEGASQWAILALNGEWWMNIGGSTPVQKVSLLVSDVDGTLVSKEKVLTQRACHAVQRLNDAGIKFAITSSRPAIGMKMFIEPLKLSSPIGAFNGAVFVMPDLQLISQKTILPAIAERVMEMIKQYKLDVWVYAGNDWYVGSRHGPHVDREEFVVQFAPKMMTDIHEWPAEAAKIVGVSDDHDAVRQCGRSMQQEFGTSVSATSSQPYYLDVTHPQANKGAVVDMLSQYFSVDRASIATIGDGLNDVLMFERSGSSIAMGNATEEVKAKAMYVTDSNENDGFAKGVETFILGALVSPN
jgi:hypothetical protein